jgi:5-formyltetrahydrofolate cyclo-ligase
MMIDKKELRQEIKNRKRQFTDEQLRKLSFTITERLLSHPRTNAAHNILLYYSLPDEVNTHELIDTLAQQGKNIFLPVVLNNEQMEIREYHGPQDLQEGSFHILEPVGKTYTQLEDIDLAFIPGVSFDKANNRLGRGKGYYDRFLAKVPHLYKIGVCFDFQKVEQLPAEENDIRMDEIL